MWSLWLIFCNCGFHSVCPLKDKKLLEASWRRDWLWGKLDFVLMGRAMLNKSLIQFSVDGKSCVPSLEFGLRPNYGRGNDHNGSLLPKDICQHAGLPMTAVVHAPDRSAGHCQPTPPRKTPGHSHMSVSVSCGVTAPFFWALVHTRFLFLFFFGGWASKSLFPQSCGRSIIKSY